METTVQASAVAQVVRYDARYEASLLRFLTKAFPESPLKGDRRFFEWRFRQNPLGSSLDHCYLALAGDQVVGQWSAIRDRVLVGGAWREAFWMTDLMVLPEHRGEHTALRLFRAVMSSADMLLVVGAGPNLMSFYNVLRWKQVHVADTLYAVLRPRRLWQLALDSQCEPHSAWRDAIYKLAAPVCRVVQTASSMRGRGVKLTSAMPAGVAALQMKLLPKLGITTDRSEAMLHWKFLDPPYGRRFFASIERGDTLAAYAAVKLMQRGEARWAEIVDYLADPDDASLFNQLMASIVREALRLDLDFARLRCSLPNHRAALRSPFWIERNRPVIDDLLIYSRDKQLVDALVQGQWHLTTIVSDRTDHGADELNESEET